MESKHKNDPLLIVCLVLFGIAGFSIGMLMPNVELTVVCFVFGSGLAFFGVALALNLVRISNKELVKDKRAALWIWTVCLLAIVVLAMGWFTLTWPTYQIIEHIEGIYTFPTEATPAITLIKNVIAWFLIIMALGLLLWAYVNSQRREEVTYPY